MAEMTIRLRCDPETGKKDIIISLRSDADALPHEHEQQHRALVDKLLEKANREETTVVTGSRDDGSGSQNKEPDSVTVEARGRGDR